MSLDPRLLAVLACPEDKGPLYYLGDEGGLYNPRLHRRYLVTDGIPVMLIDEAVAVGDDEHASIVARIEAGELAPTFQPTPS
jgi:uncharacterized protein YbaR (Trm112 family)